MPGVAAQLDLLEQPLRTELPQLLHHPIEVLQTRKILDELLELDAGVLKSLRSANTAARCERADRDFWRRVPDSDIRVSCSRGIELVAIFIVQM